MKLFACLVLSMALLAISCAGVEAKYNPHGNRTHARTVDVTFRLQVSGTPAKETTFWVAYGPLAGQFGLLELHSSGPHSFAASTSLPATGHTVFSYLAGHGAIQTPYGPAPGNPVVTIKVTGPISPSNAQFPTIRWQAPAG